MRVCGAFDSTSRAFVIIRGRPTVFYLRLRRGMPRSMTPRRPTCRLSGVEKFIIGKIAAPASAIDVYQRPRHRCDAKSRFPTAACRAGEITLEICLAAIAVADNRLKCARPRKAQATILAITYHRLRRRARARRGENLRRRARPACV